MLKLAEEIMSGDDDIVCVDSGPVADREFPEIVFGEGKTRAEVVEAVEQLVQRSPNVLVTRTDAATFGEVRNVCTEAEWHEAARLIRIWRAGKERGAGQIVVVAAETEDIPLAEEAALTAETIGSRVRRSWATGYSDVTEPELQEPGRVIIVVASLEKTLPAVIQEAANIPVVLVPRASRRHEASGIGAALDDMIESCAANVAMVSINNGFHGGFVAGLINRRW
jgi:NCAIR mutase (PurE)-related protein